MDNSVALWITAMFGLLGGIGSMIGSIYGAQEQKSTQEAINTQNIAFQEATNQQNIAEQEKFAQNSIQWKAADAKAAGINPLAALGSPASSFSNVISPSVAAPQTGNLYSQAGQSAGRALAALKSPEDQAFDSASQSLQLEKTQAEIDYTRSMTLKNTAPGTAAGVPKFTPQLAGDPGVASVTVPDVQLSQGHSGEEYPIPPHDIASLGFFHPASLQWYMRQGLLPALDESSRPAMYQGPGDTFNPFTGAYKKNNRAQSGSGWWLDREKWFGNTFQNWW